MRRFWGRALLVAACAAAASAAAYDDFSKAVNASNRGDADGALQGYTAALNVGDLAPGYIPAARLGRGRAYLSKGKCAEALADLDIAASLKPSDVAVYLARAGAHACLKQQDLAAADYAKAIALEPTARVYEVAANYDWHVGRFADAAQKFAQAIRAMPKDYVHGSYLALWYFMSADRAGTLDQAVLKYADGRIDDDKWPYPVFDFYRGKTPVEKVYAEAADSDATVATNQTCEADFYIAEWQIARKDVDAAKPLLQKAKDECPKSFYEYYAAITELGRI